MRAKLLSRFVLLVLVGAVCVGFGDEDAIDAQGTVSFVSGVQRGSAIFVTNADGTGRRQLTRQRTRYDAVGSMVWSPDGSRIAYSGGSIRDLDDLYVVRVTGGSPRRLTRSTYDERNPAWSPDGRRIAFDQWLDGYNFIYAVNADGTGLRRLTANYNWYPVWSPAGRIAFANNRGIWVMNADGSGKRRLARVGVGITGYERSVSAWSPDGRQVAFTTGEALWVVDADGKHLRKLYGVPDRTTQGPVWSPDGTTLAWAQGEGDFEILVVKADGSGLRKLTDNARIQDEGPRWSPDGRSLAFVRKRLDGTTDIYVINADGSGERSLSQTSGEDWSPVWSRDGRALAFVGRREGKTDIYVIDADGSGERNLSRTPADDWSPVWSPAPARRS